MNRLSKLARELREVGRIGGPAVALRYAADLLASLPSVIRTGSLHCVDDRFGARGGFFSARFEGLAIVLPASAIGLVREIYGRHSYFPDRSFIPKHGDTVVDLGANCGVVSILAAKLGARVRAVEAQSGFVKRCRELLALNGCEAEVMWGLLGGGTGKFRDPSAVGAAGDQSDGRFPPMVSIEEVLAGLGRIDFLKCDIEGSEFGLFEKADWLERVQRIAMEVHRRHGDPDALARNIATKGFRTSITEDGYLYAIRD